MLRGRFAPTPSGAMHIGNAGTALLAWLAVRNEGGAFILRMEDLDGPRSKPQYAAGILEDLQWLGLDWDEGPDVGGPYGPYNQSERREWYEDAFRRLERAGWLYPCFCSRKDLLQLASAPHGRASEGPVYPGFCRELSEAERAEKARVKTPSFRFRLPERTIAFRDLIMGEQSFPPGFGGDFVVKRADGIMSYQLAVVVDDGAMGVTQVVRGSDLLDSTPRQILLYEALDLPIPQFAHVPLLFGPDGKRLAKRHGSMIGLSNLRKAGVKPEAVVGTLAYLYGWLDRPEPVRARELIGNADVSRVPVHPITVEDSVIRNLLTS